MHPDVLLLQQNGLLSTQLLNQCL